MKAYLGATLIDGSGGTPVPDSILLVDEGRVVEAGARQEAELPAEIHNVDCSGCWIMPGLIEGHIHLQGTSTLEPGELISRSTEDRLLQASRDLWALIDAGYTTVRDCGEYNALFLKQAVEAGTVIGPRIVASGAMITQTAGHGDPAHDFPANWVAERRLTVTADGEDACRQAARRMLREGADFIKLCSSGGVLSDRDAPRLSQYSQAEINALVKEAHRFGKKAACHAHSTAGIKKALLAGVDTIEHGSLADDDAIEMMLGQDVVMMPTLALGFSLMHQGQELGLSPRYRQKVLQIRRRKIERLRKIIRAGVRLGCGSDFLGGALCPHGKNALELVLQQSEAGREPADILASATRVNAQALGMQDEIGLLQAGKRADFLILEGNPLDDLSLLLNPEMIRTVIQAGTSAPRLPAQLRAPDPSDQFMVQVRSGSHPDH
jgi:imidazolonepropionase-like amidohydrolase